MKGVIIMTKQKFGLTGTALKTIALVLMLICLLYTSDAADD